MNKTSKLDTLSDYIEQKIRMLTEDFKFKLTYDELQSLRGSTTEMQVDRVARGILSKRLNKPNRR